MSLISAPTTPSARRSLAHSIPGSKAGTPQHAAQPSPGRWRHPQFQEITARQKASAFTDTNLHRITWNSAALVLSFAASSFVRQYPRLHSLLVAPVSNLAGSLPLYLFQIILVFNITLALLPALRNKDNLMDIDLSATQRALLGLDPNATPPATPNTRYITPPRYPRSATPRSGTPGSRSSSAGASPLGRKGSPLGRQSGDTPNAPSATPLWQKAVSNSERRLSGSGGSLRESGIFAPSTPSPINNKVAGVPLSSKWLYERGRSSSASRSLFSQ